MQAGFQTLDVEFQRIGCGLVNADDPEPLGMRACRIGGQKDEVADGKMRVSQKLP